jgi:hypothetical protein
MISNTATTAATISPIVVPEVPELLVTAVVVVAAVVVVVGTVVEVEDVVVAGRVVVVAARLVVVGATVVGAVDVGATVVGGVVTCSTGCMAAAKAPRVGRTTTHASMTKRIPTLARIAADATLQSVVAEEA